MKDIVSKGRNLSGSLNGTGNTAPIGKVPVPPILLRRAEFLASERVKAKAKTVAPKKQFPWGVVIVFSLFFLGLINMVFSDKNDVGNKNSSTKLMSGLVKK